MLAMTNNHSNTQTNIGACLILFWKMTRAPFYNLTHLNGNSEGLLRQVAEGTSE